MLGLARELASGLGPSTPLGANDSREPAAAVFFKCAEQCFVVGHARCAGGRKSHHFPRRPAVSVAHRCEMAGRHDLVAHLWFRGADRSGAGTGATTHKKTISVETRWRGDPE